jgi:hypothetical protein
MPAERHAVVLPVGPGHAQNVLDTIDSIMFYSGAEMTLIIVDDHTDDGTYAALQSVKDKRIVLLRNAKGFGYAGLQVSTARALQECARRGPFDLVLRIDTDALVTGSQVCNLARGFLERNPHVGICGRHMIDYSGRSKRYDMHTRTMIERVGFPPRADRHEGGIGWIANLALRNGWGLGENIFGGAYFLRFECVRRMIDMGFFENIEDPRTWISEDVFFTMCALATGYDRAHFAAPTAPLALTFECMPALAADLKTAGMEIIHSVDKGPRTSAAENGGLTPREYFRRFRKAGQ